MPVIVHPARAWEAQVRVPGDKSLGHRALMFGALASGTSFIGGLSAGRDVASTMACLKVLGAGFARVREGWEVTGWGEEGWSEPREVLDCGNSGTTMRLLAGILAGPRGFAVLSGDEALRRRPMRRVVEPLRRMGATILGRDDGGFAPLAVQAGRLRGLEHASPVASAQVKSALLLAALRAHGTVAVEEPALSRDHTERMFAALGVRLERRGLAVALTGPQALRPFRFQVPGDPSSAAFLVAAAVLLPGSRVTVHDVGLNPGRIGFFHLLQRMGADVELKEEREELGEPVGAITARGGAELRGIEVGPEEVPAAVDEIPLLAVVATQAHGITRVTGAEDLRQKESDRLATITGELRRLGADARELPDGLEVRGATRLKGATVRCHRDHRLEMGLAVAALTAEGPTRLTGTGWADISFPGFWDALPGAPGSARRAR